MKSVNKVTLLGNTTNDPELKYISQGTAICNFSIATNREWKDASGQKKDEATFHRIVAWGKLGEIISQYVKKGDKIYIEGRISNRSWDDQNGQKHYMTEIVATDMVLLSNRRDVLANNMPPEPEIHADDDDEIDFDSLGMDIGEVLDGKVPEM
jgi:single-strand DNA-binding protein